MYLIPLIGNTFESAFKSAHRWHPMVSTGAVLEFLIMRMFSRWLNHKGCGACTSEKEGESSGASCFIWGSTSSFILSTLTGESTASGTTLHMTTVAEPIWTLVTMRSSFLNFLGATRAGDKGSILMLVFFTASPFKRRCLRVCTGEKNTELLDPAAPADTPTRSSISWKI